MAAKTISGLQLSDHLAQLEVSVVSAITLALDFIQVHARRILAVLMLLTILMTIFTCMVIGGISAVGLQAGQSAPLPAMLSGEHATETYGAELLHIQLTAVSGEATP